ncbi:hypothetical protein MVEN_01993000 [Mycena venus]|uniref:Uncharacterized protein n=1 Tax=Mycena venus TaxID=2733690 RepID=A0A8H7CIQ2_9AGAR|nr:hypothetical protein MVEN_01993000 [Mycena venus]
MHAADAIRHEESVEHTYLVREISKAGDPPSSPFHMSSPPQYSSDPVSPGIDSEYIQRVVPFFTVPGPQLSVDGQELIYDDWDPVWESRMPTRPNADSLEIDEDYFDTPDASDAFYGMPELLETDISDGEEAPDDDPFEAVGQRSFEAEFEGVGEEFVLNIDDVPEEEDRSEPLDSSADAKNWWPWANREEFANPLVRPYIRVLSEDSAERLDEACQAQKWKLEVAADLAGPMARHENKDYFVNEPALANIGTLGEYAAVLPSRWFLRKGKIWAKVQRLISHPDEKSDSLVIDNCHECEEIPLSNFFLSFEELKTTHTYHNLKNPAKITGIMTDSTIEETNIVAPNPLRIIAKGRRVLSVPIWFYCDDTSGNVSKKWNKHNSLLISLAGLEPDKAHLLYNVLFLATSNLASPLEMFDAVIEMLQDACKSGIEAYDCQYQEMVLLLPWILAMLGDNPMQSEFASHIGLTGKCFYRVCNVKGADAKNRPQGDEGERQRVADFLQTSDLRTKDATLKALREQLEDHIRGAPSTASTKATTTGVKDRYFQHFADQLAVACAEIKEQQRDSSLKGNDHLKKVLGDLGATMPADDAIFSPSLRLDDFDPNSDSPVEILHVILLGFVKYFWRDAVSRQSKAGKEILKARINSFDAAPLGLADPRGSTLVQYAGSLTGRDFRLVVQIAPAVLYGMIPDEAHEAWLALCRLAPLAYQPEIVITWHAVRHLVSGGWVVKDSSNAQNPVVKQAGSGVLALVKDKVFLRLMGMTDFFASSNYGKYTLDLKVEPMRDWALTKSAQFTISIPRKFITNSILRSCSCVVLKNGDIARVNGFLIHRNSSGQLQIGRVEEIIADVSSGRILGICLQHFLVGESVLPYQFPALTGSNNNYVWRKIQASLNHVVLKDCLASASTIHNCASHNCHVTTTREIIQESRKTGRFDNEVTHTPDNSDHILNLAHLRSARYLQKFQPAARYPNIPRAQLIADAVQHRHDLTAEQSTPPVSVTPAAATDVSVAPATETTTAIP